MSVRLVLVAIIFLVDLWAILAVLAEPRVRGRRLRWLLCVVGLPVIGVILWVRRRPRRDEGSLPPLAEPGPPLQ
jgi:hypothetical protein